MFLIKLGGKTMTWKQKQVKNGIKKGILKTVAQTAQEYRKYPDPSCAPG